MLSKLQTFLFPNEKNNQKAKAIHSSSLFTLIFLLVVFQSSLNLISRLRPGVLGFASNINVGNLLRLTNQRREEYGFKPLVLNELLSEAAQQKASAMFAFGCWSHNCDGRTPWWFFQNVDYDYTFAGENLARDFGESEEVVAAWMDSPTHRDNLLSQKYQDIGFAVVNGVLNGEETTLVVQLFGTQTSTQAIASGMQEISSKVEGVVKEEEARPMQIMISEAGRQSKPIISEFMLTKTFSLILVGFLILIFALDSILIYQKRIVRVSGKSFIHLSFFIIILLGILLSYQGQIL